MCNGGVLGHPLIEFTLEEVKPFAIVRKAPAQNQEKDFFKQRRDLELINRKDPHDGRQLLGIHNHSHENLGSGLLPGNLAVSENLQDSNIRYNHYHSWIPYCHHISLLRFLSSKGLWMGSYTQCSRFAAFRRLILGVQDKTIPGGYCPSTKSLFEYIGIVNIPLDLLCVLYPMPILWKLQMPIQKKIVISGILALGLA